jgi:DivIVA domain-containing protein
VVPVLLVVVAVAVVVAVLAVATGRWPADPLAAATHSTPDHGLPAEPRAVDVDDVRFDTAARGYRMDQVDSRLDVLRVALAERERRLEELAAQPRAEDAAGVPPLADDDDPATRAGEG